MTGSAGYPAGSAGNGGTAGRQRELSHRRSGSGAAVSPFEVEQEALEWKPAAVAGERAVGADDAMARDDDGDRIAPVGAADGAAGRGASDGRGDLEVGAG